jgi:adenine phosphoribosyltransferase
MSIEAIKAAIRDVPDFPKPGILFKDMPGILFKDITPVLQDPKLFRATVDLFVERLKGKRLDKIAAVEARGFILGAPVAERLGVGFVPIRKQGKLPYKTFEQTYALEYGTATVAIHQDACHPGDRVALLDDLLATGGTVAAAAALIEKAGGKIVEIDFLVELLFLKGRAKLPRYDVFAALAF